MELYSAAVFTRDVSLEGFTHEQWARLGDVFRPLDRPDHTALRDAEGPEGGVVAVTTGSTPAETYTITVRGRDITGGPGHGTAHTTTFSLTAK